MSRTPAWWQRQPKATRIGVSLVGIAVALFIVGVTFFGSSKKAAASTVHVVYKVDGTGQAADLTYRTATGIEQKQKVTLPVKRTSDHFEGIELTMPKGAALYISAQKNQGSGTVVCHILVNDVEVSTNSSAGDFAIATCSA